MAIPSERTISAIQVASQKESCVRHACSILDIAESGIAANVLITAMLLFNYACFRDRAIGPRPLTEASPTPGMYFTLRAPRVGLTSGISDLS